MNPEDKNNPPTLKSPQSPQRRDPFQSNNTGDLEHVARTDVCKRGTESDESEDGFLELPWWKGAKTRGTLRPLPQKDSVIR
jgi:hypothetical protein